MRGIWKGPGRDDHLLAFIRAVVELNEVVILGPADRANAAAQLDRQVEIASIIGEITHDLVATWVTVRIAGDRASWQAVVARRREQPQRVPASASRRCRRLAGLKNHEPPSPLS